MITALHVQRNVQIQPEAEVQKTSTRIIIYIHVLACTPVHTSFIYLANKVFNISSFYAN